MEKVLFITGILSDGGAERVLSILAKEMCDMGYEVSIITIYGDRNDYIKDKRINLYPIKHRYKNRILRALEIVCGMRQLTKNLDPDVVISFDAPINIYTILSLVLLKKKLIVSERNDPYQYPKKKYLRQMRDILYMFCDGIVFQTDDAKKYFRISIQEKSVIITNPIEFDLPYWNENSNEKTIITACRLSKQKNLPMLIKAYSKFSENFPEYQLKIFGDGELYNELQKLIEQSGLTGKVLLMGFSNNIHFEMANSNMFIISSDYEGISNSMLEALAIGVPVISTNTPIGGAKMFIKNEENGILIEAGNVDELVVAMNKVISNKEFATHLSYKARKLRNDLLPRKITKKWIEYVLKICGGNDAKKSKL